MRRKILIPVGAEEVQTHWELVDLETTRAGMPREAFQEWLNEQDTPADLTIEQDGLVVQSHHNGWNDLHAHWQALDDRDEDMGLDIRKTLGLNARFPLNVDGKQWKPMSVDVKPSHKRPLRLPLKGGRFRIAPNKNVADKGAIAYPVDEREGCDLHGWLICHRSDGVMDSEQLLRCMRITIIINLWQRPKHERESLKWFDLLSAHEGMPTLEEFDDRAWMLAMEHGLEEHIDPARYLSPYELARLAGLTINANKLDSVVATNNDLMGGTSLSHIMPLRVVRIGKYPSPFTLCQPVGLTDLDTLGLAPNMVRINHAGLENTRRQGDFILTSGHGADFCDRIWDLKRTASTKCFFMGTSKGWGQFLPFHHFAGEELLSILGAQALSYGRHQDKHYTFSSLHDLAAHLLAEDEAYDRHDDWFAMTDEVEDGADPESFVPTWKDKRPLKVLDYAKPRYPHWSDLLKCRKCNQRVQVLLPSGNALSYVACPSCKDEEGIRTEHLMNDWKPASVALSVRKGQGETMLED